MKQHDSLVGTQPKSNYSFFKKISIAALLMAPLLSVYSQDNLAAGKTATYSSGEWGGTTTLEVTDGNLSSRWANNNTTEPETSWIYVDLENRFTINQVVIKWQAAYATDYDVEISDNTTFTNATKINVNNGDGATDEVQISGTGRYLRIYCNKKAPVWGYSIFEIDAYGTEATQQLGVDSVQGEDAPSVAIYPNPASDFVKLSFPEKLNNTVVTVYDLSGKQLIQTKLNDAAEEGIININQLSKGAYILNIKSEGKNWSKKLIKE